MVTGRFPCTPVYDPVHAIEQQCSVYGFYLGAAYRNRTDDLRITRGPLTSARRLTCTDSMADRTLSTDRPGNFSARRSTTRSTDPNGLLEVAKPAHSGRYQREEHVGGLGLERDVVDLR